LLDNLPPYFARKKEYKDLSRVTPDGIKGKHNETLDVTTIREYMNLARALFTFAVDNDYITVNPVLSGMIPPKKGNARKQRYPFSDPEDLERIFNPNLFFDWTKDRPERFWVPLLSLYTGARLEELCQLEVADVSEYDGIWCIHVRGETSDLDDPDDQKGRVKHETNPRILPLHPFLVDHLRFPEYVKQVQARGQKRIFHDLNKNKSTNWKYGHGPSKHFGYYLRKKVRISDKKKTFHSFRHNAADHLYDKLVLESVIEELEGRAGKTQTRKRYTTGYRVPVLYEEAILKLDYKVDLTHLKNSKYVIKE
jgi:integrase